MLKKIISPSQISQLSKQWSRNNLSIGFVPTMGALHSGHVSLVQEALKKCDKVILSIFINPSQFAPHEDLNKYPKVLDEDLHLLSKLNKELTVFVPTVESMYPSGITTHVAEQKGTFVEVKGISHILEGSIRPHFFRGVSTVVTKLLNITTPHLLFLGQKDAQQCVVIKNMLTDLLFPTKLVIVPTQRDVDGLALSSRNRYLSPSERAIAPTLYKALCTGRDYINAGQTDMNTVFYEMKNIIGAVNGVECEYFSLNDPITLQPIPPSQLDNGGILSGAVRIGNTRLIDNVLVKGLDVEKWTNIEINKY